MKKPTEEYWWDKLAIEKINGWSEVLLPWRRRNQTITQLFTPL